MPIKKPDDLLFWLIYLYHPDIYLGRSSLSKKVIQNKF